MKFFLCLASSCGDIFAYGNRDYWPLNIAAWASLWHFLPSMSSSASILILFLPFRAPISTEFVSSDSVSDMVRPDLIY